MRCENLQKGLPPTEMDNALKIDLKIVAARNRFGPIIIRIMCVCVCMYAYILCFVRERETAISAIIISCCDY